LTHRTRAVKVTGLPVTARSKWVTARFFYFQPDEQRTSFRS
jgi:hypothetical protein